MDALLAIERSMGRLRTVKWGPRKIDLDLLHVEGLVCTTPVLVLPHPGIAQRNFVLVPWADIAPETQVPGIGKIGAAAGAIDRTGLDRWPHA